MKTEETPNFIQRHGVVDKIACTMSINAHAFKLLARQYSDPIKAILQEIGCNAMDSHTRVKNDQPFLVHLPSRFDNHLRIRDFGTGMSEDKIRNVYANWMNSDKRDTNAEVGYFGIGSKTPLAYTDSFNITSYTDGVMRMYTLCRNEQDIPELQYYGAADTEEPNGVEISFAVKPEDFEIFKEKAIEVYQYFPLKPLINDNPKFLPEKEIRYQGSNWKIYDDKDYRDYARVVMGGVAYTIDSTVITRINNHQVRNFLHAARGLIFDVEIGTLDITPSREALELTPKTISKITECGKFILDEISETTIKTILSLENVQHLSEWSYDLLVTKTINDMNNLGISFNSKLFQRTPAVYPKLCQQSEDIECLGYYSENKNGRAKWYPIHGNHKISPNTKNRFILAHELEGRERRLRDYLSDNFGKIRSCYVIKRYTDAPLTRQDVMNYFGFNDDDNCFIDVDSLPVPSKAIRTRITSGARRERKPRDMARVMRFNPSKFKAYDPKTAWEEELIDPNDGIWYMVEIHRWQLQGKINYPDLNDIVTACNIRVIAANDQKSLKVPNVKPLLASLPELLKNKLDEPIYKENVNLYFARTKLYQTVFPNARRLCRMAEAVNERDLPADHPLIQIKKMLEAVENFSEPALADIIYVVMPDVYDKETKICGKTIEEWEVLFKMCAQRYEGIHEHNVSVRLILAVDFYEANGKM